MKLNIVPARQGLQWVRQGVRTFRQQPLAFEIEYWLAPAPSPSSCPAVGRT